MVALALPGRAQQSSPSRFAFADTTLLRDTLGLRFDRLFPLADSLGVVPDTLRALSIRYRLPLLRIVFLADSLQMPVDSVGPVTGRFNPLTTVVRRLTTFRYNSTYNIAQTSSTWMNGSDYNFVLGSLFLRNTTNITMDRFRAGGRTSLRETRSSVTEGGWKFSPRLSLGGRANLERFDSFDPGSINNQGETKNEFQLSLRSRQQPSKSLSSELNFFSGLLDLSNVQQVKRGASGDLNGRLRWQGGWLTHELTGQVNGNLARTRLPSSIENLSTRDLSNNLRGTLGLFPGRPVGLNLNYQVRRSRVESPGDSGRITRNRSDNSGADAALRLRRDNERYLNLTGRFGNSDRATGTGLNSRSSARDIGFGTDGRWTLLGWSMDGRFANGWTRSEYPNRAAGGGYGESLHTVSIEGTVTRNLTRKMVVKANGTVSLSTYRYFLIGIYPNPPVKRDQYRQSYRVDLLYNPSERVNSGLALDVSRNMLVNIPAASTAGNNESHTYRAEWRWSYRVFGGLTASQFNTLTADYLFYNFLHQNDRLSLEYNINTTLNAVMSPRFSLDIMHLTRFQPAGNYTLQPDGLVYLSRTDESQNYTLRSRMAYTPTPALSLVLQPDYLAADRLASQGGGLAPQRQSRQLNFSGGASLNLPFAGRGRLTGDILRSYRADRTVNYSSSGVATPTPRSQSDYWNGSLQLSWEL